LASELALEDWTGVYVGAAAQLSTTLGACPGEQLVEPIPHYAVVVGASRIPRNGAIGLFAAIVERHDHGTEHSRLGQRCVGAQCRAAAQVVHLALKILREPVLECAEGLHRPQLRDAHEVKAKA
jgi:hypothetical protein